MGTSQKQHKHINFLMHNCRIIMLLSSLLFINMTGCGLFSAIAGDNKSSTNAAVDEANTERKHHPLFYAESAADVRAIIAKKGKWAPFHNNDWSPVHEAAKKGNAEVVKELLAAGPKFLYYGSLYTKVSEEYCDLSNDDFHSTGLCSKNRNYPWLPLEVAVFCGKTNVVKVLLTIDPTLINTRGDACSSSLIYYATQKGNPDIVKALIDAGADVNGTNKDWRPIHLAAKEGHLDVVKVLIDAGADVNGTDNETPIHIAAKEGHLDIVKALIDAGADLIATGDDGWTPLYYAVNESHSDVVKVLIDAGAGFKLNRNGWTLIHRAAEKGDLNLIKELIAAGADVNGTNNKDETPIHIAAKEGHLDVVKELIDAGADVNAIAFGDEKGWGGYDFITPVTLAMQNRHSDIVKELRALNNADDTTNIENFYKQMEECLESGKPTNEGIERRIIRKLREDKYSDMDDESIKRTKDFNLMFNEEYKSTMNYYNSERVGKRQEACAKINIENFNDSQQLPIIYDYCHGSEVAWLGNIGGHYSENYTQLRPQDLIVDNDKYFTRFYNNKSQSYSFKECIELFRIYTEDYITSKAYFIDRLKQDQDKTAKDAAAVRKKKAGNAKKAKKQQDDAWRNYYYYNYTPRGKCESECNKTYKQNTSSWNTCMGFCKDMRGN